MEADMSLTGMAMDIMDGTHNRYKEDHKLVVSFFYAPVQDSVKTLEEGRPMYKDTEFVRILVPGDRSSMVVREAHQEDKNRFALQYAKWKAGNDQATTGTPLEKWPLITGAQVEELKYFHIRTVEQLADVSDAQAQKFMGINMLRQRARDFVAAAAGAQPLAEMRAELEDRDNTIDAMKKAMDDMAARLAALEA